MLNGELRFKAIILDYFGPVLVGRVRASSKRHDCKFTCPLMRRVYLEVSHKLKTDCFCSAFKTFGARHANSRMIYSDNGAKFRGDESDF